MQISIPLDQIQFEVRDGKLIFCPSESVVLARIILEEISGDLENPESATYEILSDLTSVARAMDVADRLADLTSAMLDRELTDAEISELRAVQDRGIAWVTSTAKEILSQDALGREMWLDEVAERGPRESDFLRLNWCRANGNQDMRRKAGDLLVKLAGSAR